MFPGERRVALTPRSCEALQKLGVHLAVERGAGIESGFSDEQYTARGAILLHRSEVFERSDLIAQVRSLGANPQDGRADLPLLRPKQTLVGFGEPLTALSECTDLASTGVSFLAMELIPRITRAQSMDALSSMATLAGYQAVILAAGTLPKIFPMLVTAAGTITPAKAFVLGAGVAGLQAIATARRLGAVVTAYDIRPTVKEQVESVGAKFLVLDVDADASEDKGGYAKAMGEDFYRRQRELLTQTLREQDIVITTAAVPGSKAPTLITSEMVAAMVPGSVIVDVAAERGGNCALTRPGETVVEHGVTILGPLNLPSTLPRDASQMYSANITALLRLLMKDSTLTLNVEDEVIRESLVTHDYKVVHPRVVESLNRNGRKTMV
jgi:NAD(P) transhydrogenase subunit alpha